MHGRCQLNEVKKNEEPLSNTNPTLINTSIKLAFSLATIKSEARAMEHPAPAATPFNLQIIGLGILRISLIIGLYLLVKDSINERFSAPAMAFKSCPLQKALPAPVIITTRVSWSFLALLSASCSS